MELAERLVRFIGDTDGIAPPHPLKFSMFLSPQAPRLRMAGLNPAQFLARRNKVESRQSRIRPQWQGQPVKVRRGQLAGVILANIGGRFVVHRLHI